MNKILFVAPTEGNGGILSWAKKFVNSFPDNEFELIHSSSCYRRCRTVKTTFLKRIVDGLLDLRYAYNNAKNVIKHNDVTICHICTSGDIGSFRDIILSRLCSQNGLKTVLHCHYGCVPEDYAKKNLVGRLLRRSFNKCDQIWVLDKRTYNYLINVDSLKDKVCLTPNSIEVKEKIDVTPKDYKRIAFVGNLEPTKGLFELTEAVLKCDVRLDIIGPGTDEVNARLNSLVGNQLNKKVFIHGKLPNTEAVNFMHDVDMIALPTYYRSEAFPISILEAMSLTKMVISCPRAAIPDMLTDREDKPCGLLVPEKSVQGIVDAINWCQSHTTEADIMCQEAYEKVFECYRTEVVYELYRDNYRQLVNN